MTIQLDAATWNRYRLRCAKLSEVLPRSERSLAPVRMTEKRLDAVGNCGWRRYGDGLLMWLGGRSFVVLMGAMGVREKLPLKRSLVAVFAFAVLVGVGS